MKTFKTIALAMLAATLTACSNDDNGGKAPKYINIDAQLSQPTKTTIAADGTMSFTSGDAISVYAWTGSASTLPTTADGFVVAGNTNTFNGSTWTASPQMLWKDLTSPHFFIATYPQRDITQTNFTLDTSKQAECDVMVATNLGTDSKGIIATETAIPLAFDHLMAKLQVNLQFRNQWGESGPTSVAVSINSKGSATIDYLAKSVTPTGDASYINLPSVAAAVEGYAKSYESIVIPVSDLKNIKIAIDGHDYIYTHDTAIQLQGGKTTIVNLMVGRNEITLGSMSIKGWEELVVIGDDKPVEVTD